MQLTEKRIIQIDQPFQLESGSILPGYSLAYTTLGRMSASGDNVIWIFHALTANSDPSEWWPGLVGEGKLFDPEHYFIVCANMPGSCYGSTGPLSENPATGQPWFHEFPFFTPRDMIRAYEPLRRELGIEKIHIGIGGSMGGQQLLEWAVEDKNLFEHIIPIATNAVHSAWGRAFNASQRMCIENDPTWKTNTPEAGLKGMEIARSIALISYRHYRTYEATQQDDDRLENFKSDSYQRYQGLKLSKRFNAFSYYALSKGMDSHNIGRGRNGVINALNSIKAATLSIAVESDVLYPPSEQEFIARHVPKARFESIDSLYGHDGFLLEYEKIEKIITDFIAEVKSQKSKVKSY
ncbi:MAG TPA: homoserine O-acetyltransferase [Chitinophagaceae bacterium]|nr:homoserine O-acetyltransferase [Chitinophagaceae bacterium]